MATSTYLYDLLDISPEATLEEIKTAFRAKSKECHPDIPANKGVDPSEFENITIAHNILQDQKLRDDYDKYGLFDGQTEGDANSYVAINRLMKFIGDVIFKNVEDPSELLTVNIVEVAQNMANGAYSSCQGNVRRIESAIENINLMKERYTYKGSEVDVFALAVKTQIENLGKEVREQKAEMKVAKMAVEMLQHYEYKT